MVEEVAFETLTFSLALPEDYEQISALMTPLSLGPSSSATLRV